MTTNRKVSSFNSSECRGWKYQVFLSFRGEDTRHKFTDHLYRALCRSGINAFMDENLRTGAEIAPAILRVIEESRVSIVVFSKNYASATWCLDELVKILECKKEKQQMVLPIFYEIDPSDVRHQKESIGNAMAAHEERFKNNIEKVQIWRSALRKAANLRGEAYRNGSEYEFIQNIIRRLSRFLNHQLLHITEKSVGLGSRTQEVLSLLVNSSDDGDDDHDVCMVGIYGIGGIGKTTIAKSVYNLVAPHFESTCFVADVRENSNKKGLVHIQEAILTDILEEKDIKLSNVHKGVQVIQERLCGKKILLILDDVDSLQQLHALAGGCNWFGSGSRVIITTRDKHLVGKQCPDRIYEVKALDDKKALELFCWNAFRKCKPTDGYADISNRVIRYAQGVPLALEIIGSNLFGRDRDEWECTLDKYNKIMNRDLYNVLRTSYENLEFDEKEIFLDIACFFEGEDVDYIEKILVGCGFNAKSSLRVLEDKCFIKRLWHKLWMHDLIRSLGREIVREESEREPGKRSRLWFHEDALQVLTRDTGTSKVQGIKLYMPLRTEVPWSGNAFKKMINLRILIIKNARFLKPPKQLPNSLRVIVWEDYPSSSLPSNFYGNELLEFRVPNATHPIQLQEQFKRFQNITIMDLRDCEWVKEVPDVSAIPNLTKLNLNQCYNLVKIDESVGFLHKLQSLFVGNCFKLRNFPTGNGLKSLQYLALFGCRNIERLPDILQLKGLLGFSLLNTGIDIESDSGRQVLQGIQEMKYVFFLVSGSRVPRYFDHQAEGQFMSFWIRQKFPDISIGFAFQRRKFKEKNLFLEFCMSMGQLTVHQRVEILMLQSCEVWILHLPYFLPRETRRDIEQKLHQDWVHVHISAAISNDTPGRTCKCQPSVVTTKGCGIYINDHRCDANMSYIDPCSQYPIKNRRLTATSASKPIISSEGNDSLSLYQLSKKVWHLNISPQAKHFAWTAILDKLPSKHNLVRTGNCNVIDRCDRCMLWKETTLHVLKECQWARGVWMLSPLGLKVDRMQAKDFRGWMHELVTILDAESLELFVMLAWGLWTERDKIRSGRKTEDAVSLIRRMEILLEDHRRTHIPMSQAMLTEDDDKWIHQKQDISKIEAEETNLVSPVERVPKLKGKNICF